MTEYDKLVRAEQAHCHTIEIREKATGKTGVANSCAYGVEVWYGADDGGDDKTVTYEEFNRDFEITAALGGQGSANTPASGLTVSVPRNALADDALERLQKLVDSKAGLLKKALGVPDLPIVKTADQIQFPWFPEPDADEFVAYAELVDRLCAAARNAQRINTTNRSIESEKYAMRCFLIRLGFTGPEHKKARAVLTRNLSGSAAFKSQADADAFRAKQKEKRSAPEAE